MGFQGAVVSFYKYQSSKRLVELMGGEAYDAKILSVLHFPEYPMLYQTEFGGTKVAIVNPSLVRPDVIAEELAYLGVDWIVACGSTGSLVKEIPKRAQVAAVSALPTDGTSRTYDASKLSISDNMCKVLSEVSLNLGVEIIRATAATVDAIYREEYSLIESWRRDGATVINTETSPLYAASFANGLECIWLGQVSDCLLPDQPWEDWYGDRKAARELENKIVMEFYRILCERTNGGASPMG